MKKHFMKVAFVAAFASIAGFGVYTSQNKSKFSDLNLADVEAIAACEVSATQPNSGCCVQDVNNSKEYCASGGWGPACCGTI